METRHPDPDVGPCLPLIGVIATAMLVVVATMGLILIAASIDWQAVADFIAPTAAQSRETGWQQIAEGL
ncbi:hypothetical protein PE067_08160 [Paracoccus sp. DMF-8]|uniref:hypothetical protein n=1 Tax=Paracoccus sp. DMF-8 TaxID=3019445 RepID=UPI0023E8B5A6|nr:hypothetical protein [Paracoccus sp. DMF-8]MDF3606101.1 hypothetical protein [Paracoccus sp. DMF-8]